MSTEKNYIQNKLYIMKSFFNSLSTINSEARNSVSRNNIFTRPNSMRALEALNDEALEITDKYKKI